jgi:threonine synthase
LLDRDETGIFLGTAHPAKFKDIVEDTLRQEIEMPEYLKNIQNKEKLAEKMPADYQVFRDWLMKHL